MIASKIDLMTDVHVPISVGELVDKITILRIKASEIKDTDKIYNVRAELESLERVMMAVPLLQSPEAASLISDLASVNKQLWVIEDDIRDCERGKDFGPRFIELARSVYYTNDKRAKLKKDINSLAGSKLVEEKSYSDYS